MPLFDCLDVYDDSTPRSAVSNMALDEALLEFATGPLIRFYRWDHPALSFGYFGKFEDVAEHETERDIVRRWTGGGIVFHGADLTYALVIPASRRDLMKSSKSVYDAVHRALREALLQCGHQTELAGNPSNVISESCFERPVVADLLAQGRKVAGAAQRRSRAGLLQQGSIQNLDVSGDLTQSFATQLALQSEPRELTDEHLRRAAALARAKYATPGWLHRR